MYWLSFNCRAEETSSRYQTCKAEVTPPGAEDRRLAMPPPPTSRPPAPGRVTVTVTAGPDSRGWGSLSGGQELDSPPSHGVTSHWQAVGWGRAARTRRAS